MQPEVENPETAATSFLSDKVAVIVTHILGSGPSNHLEAYISQRCEKVLSIDHPLIYESPAMSHFRLFENGTLVATGEHSLRGPEVAAFIQEVVITIWWTIRLAPHNDLFFGIDALNCIAGTLIKGIRHTRRVIFYVIDWSPKRFENWILNVIYHFLDRLATLCATETWNQSHAIDKGRWHGIFWTWVGRYANKRVRIVPNAVARVGNQSRSGASLPFRLVFLGHLIEKQGVQLAISALPRIAELYENVDLVVIGNGPYLTDLQNLASAIGVGHRVTFLGYIDDEDEVLQVLESASCGLAPYIESEESFTKFADPGKLKNYLAAGLPIVMTNVPPNAEQLERSGCAIIVRDTVEGVTAGVCSLLAEDKHIRNRRHEDAIAMMKGLDWNSVFANALASMANQ